MSGELEITRVENTIEILKPEGIRTIEIPKGLPGEGVPTGGSEGQVLVKTSNTNYDTEWKNLKANEVSVDTMTGMDGTDVDEILNELADSKTKVNPGLALTGSDDNRGTTTISIDIDSAIEGNSITAESYILVQTLAGLRKVKWEDFGAVSGGGSTLLRGSILLDPSGNTGVITGDSLNASITEGVAPAVETDTSVTGVSYMVTNTEVQSSISGTGVTYSEGDYVEWNGSGWIRIIRSLGDHVSSFNGRIGDVTPQLGDYSVSLIEGAAGKLINEIITGNWEFQNGVITPSLNNGNSVINIEDTSISIDAPAGGRFSVSDAIAILGSATTPTTKLEASGNVLLQAPVVNVSETLEVAVGAILGDATGYSRTIENLLTVKVAENAVGVRHVLGNGSYIQLENAGDSNKNLLLTVGETHQEIDSINSGMKLNANGGSLDINTIGGHVNVDPGAGYSALYRGSEILTVATGLNAADDVTVTGIWEFINALTLQGGLKTNSIESVDGIVPLEITSSGESILKLKDAASKWLFKTSTGEVIMTINNDKSVEMLDDLVVTGGITSEGSTVLTELNYGTYIDLNDYAKINDTESISSEWTFSKNPVLVEDTLKLKDLKIQSDVQFKMKKLDDSPAEVGMGGLGISDTIGDAVNNIPTNGIYSKGDIESSGAINSRSKTHNVVPVGSTAERPVTPSQGGIRFNSTASQFEGWTGTKWVSLGGIDSPEQVRGTVGLIPSGNTGNISGDLYNSTIAENVAPNPENVGDSVNGYSYVVETEQDSSITGELKTFTAGDLVMWFDGGWIQIDRNSPVGVESFNSRTGNVIPESGDYSASQITSAADVTQDNDFEQDVNVQGSFTMGAFEMYYDGDDNVLKFIFN